MASSQEPKIYVFKQDGATAIVKGVAVKLSTDNQHVTPCGASTDDAIGISQNVTANAGDKCEVAVPGGGAKALAHGTISAGELVVPYTDGSMQPTTASGDSVIGIAMQSAVAGDIFEVAVIRAVAAGSAE